jgi:hypothetical protein
MVLRCDRHSLLFDQSSSFFFALSGISLGNFRVRRRKHHGNSARSLRPDRAIVQQIRSCLCDDRESLHHSCVLPGTILSTKLNSLRRRKPVHQCVSIFRLRGRQRGGGGIGMWRPRLRPMGLNPGLAGRLCELSDIPPEQLSYVWRRFSNFIASFWRS